MNIFQGVQEGGGKDEVYAWSLGVTLGNMNQT